MDKGIRHELMGLLRLTDHMLKCSIDRRVKTTGLYRSQHRMLMFLGEHPDCSQTELAERMDISSAAVTVALQKLEKGGFIQRQMHKADNRVNHVIITEKGRNAIDMSENFFKRIEQAAFDGFSKEELETLAALLKRVLKNEAKIDQE